MTLNPIPPCLCFSYTCGRRGDFVRCNLVGIQPIQPRLRLGCIVALPRLRRKGTCSPVPGGLTFGLWTLEWVVRGYVGIHRARKAIQVDGCRPRRMSLRRFPRLFPIRNPCELRGLYSRSYFGPRTCVGGITNVIEVGGALNPGFPFSPLLREV